jgi:DNA-binding LacI/PurR family transcriptional regulator
MEAVPRKPATIRDVARLAGVGLGTVSRVINDSPQVSDGTRARVHQAIEELNYVPNPTARRLSLGRTLTVAAIAPFFTRPSITERLRGIENTLAESEYDLIIFNVETVERRDELIREVPRRERVDGVLILSVSPRDEDVMILENAGVPIILVDANHPSLTSLNRVIVDDVEGGFIATKYLIDLGHTRIGYVSDYLENEFNFTSSKFRFKGYRKALEKANIPFRNEFHAQGEHGRYEAYQLSKTLLSIESRPTAIFASSDTQAMGVLEAARELELSVPEELSVVGYDDIEVAEYLGLTTIRQSLFESGQRGVELLLKSFEKSIKEPICDVLPIELVIRSTTAAYVG